MTVNASTQPPPEGGHPQRDELSRELQATLADLVDLALVGKQLYWSVVGPLSRPLHFQLAELVDAWRDLADAVAERAHALGTWPDGQASTLTAADPFGPLASGPLEDFVVVQELTRRLAQISERTRKRMERVGAIDLASQDVLIHVLQTLENDLSMIRAQLPAA